MISKLTNLRTKIDKVDKKILQLLSERVRLVGQIAVEKKKSNLSPYDSKRWHELIESRKIVAKTMGLDQKMVVELWEEIHKNALKLIEEYEKK